MRGRIGYMSSFTSLKALRYTTIYFLRSKLAYVASSSSHVVILIVKQ